MINKILKNIIKISTILISVPLLSENYIVKIEPKSQFSVPKNITTEGNWVNTGSVYDCSSWYPSTGSVDSGTSFTQYSDCKQNQTRTITTEVQDLISGGSKIISSITENQVIDFKDSRISTGTRPVGTYTYNQSSSVVRTYNGTYAQFSSLYTTARNYSNSLQQDSLNCRAGLVGRTYVRHSVGSVRNQANNYSTVTVRRVVYTCVYKY